MIVFNATLLICHQKGSETHLKVKQRILVIEFYSKSLKKSKVYIDNFRKYNIHVRRPERVDP